LLEIDGSEGEGGGAILRTALSLSAALGEPFRIFGVRKGRKQPGLKAQHLAGVRAAARLCGAEVEGCRIGSTELSFSPGRLCGGRLEEDVGTAGSVTPVLQSLMPALAFAERETEIALRGGTDVAWSPPLDYLCGVLLPVAGLMGFAGSAEAVRRGYYPCGGGEARACFSPARGGLKPLRLSSRGALLRVRGISSCSLLPVSVAERQAASAAKALSEAKAPAPEIRVEAAPASSPGSVITLRAEYSSGAVLGASALGAKGKSAEEAGAEAAGSLIEAMRSGACADPHLCDQLLAFCALARGESEFTSSGWTPHSESNANVIQQFINSRPQVERTGAGGAFRVRVQGTSRGGA
jgi:RNA 3'-phosphate cyclase